MFVRYLGGGIGHLEQFPPADNDCGVTYEYEEDDGEVTDDAETGDKNGGDEDGELEDSDEDGEAADSGYSDPGESSDEDMGNTY